MARLVEGEEGVRGKEGIPGPPARDGEGAGAFCEEQGLDYAARRNFGAPGDKALELMV